MRKSNGSVQMVLHDDDLKLIFKNCHRLLETFGHSEVVQEVCLKLLLIILTGVDNINENQLIEYLMVENMFESLTQLVHRLGSNADQKATDIGNHVIPIIQINYLLIFIFLVLIIILLCNYRKNESTNPYIVQLSILADEQILNSFSSIINNKLVE